MGTALYIFLVVAVLVIPVICVYLVVRRIARRKVKPPKSSGGMTRPFR